MAEYKGIHGIKIQNYTSDPANPLVGEVWYNSTSNSLKYFYVNSGAWATGGDMNTARKQLGGSGTNTAALAFGGTTNKNETEQYNGTAWTEVNNLNTARNKFYSKSCYSSFSCWRFNNTTFYS